MKFEKRSGGADSPAPVPDGGASPQADKPSAGKKPVVIYIMILFIVAFLLMALSFVMHQRSNSEVLGELQNSVSAMQEVQATQDALVNLQGQLQDAEDTIEELESAAEEQQQALDAAQREAEALLALYTLQQQYTAGDLEACQNSIQAFEAAGYRDDLPQSAEDGVTPPSQRYDQLKEAVEARAAAQP